MIAPPSIKRWGKENKKVLCTRNYIWSCKIAQGCPIYIRVFCPTIISLNPIFSRYNSRKSKVENTDHKRPCEISKKKVGHCEINNYFK